MVYCNTKNTLFQNLETCILFMNTYLGHGSTHFPASWKQMHMASLKVGGGGLSTSCFDSVVK